MLIIRPHLRAIMEGSAAFEAWNAADKLIAITALRAATGSSPRLASTKLMNTWNAANSRNQLMPFGKPNRITRRSSARDSGVASPRGALPQRRQNAIARNAKPSQLAITLASAAPSTPSAGAPRCPSMNIQLKNTAVTIDSTPAIICIHVLPSPPYQLPSASTPTTAPTDSMRIAM